MSILNTHTHPFNGPLSGTTRVSRHQKGETNLDFTGARDREWQWHQLGMCKSAPRSRQITTPAPHHSVFYRPDALPAAQPTASKNWRHKLFDGSIWLFAKVSQSMVKIWSWNIIFAGCSDLVASTSDCGVRGPRSAFYPPWDGKMGISLWAVVDVNASYQFLADSQPRSIGLVWGLAATRYSFIKWTG